MAQRTKGNMWCPRCGPVLGVKNMHRVRNSGSAVGELLLPGIGLLGAKVEPYYCPNCGSRVHSQWMHDLTAGMNQPKTQAADSPSASGAAAVTLTLSGDKKIQVIKVVRRVTGLGLKEAKSLVDHPPAIIATGISEAAAEQLGAEILAAGGSVEITVEARDGTGPAEEPDTPLDPGTPTSLAGDLERLAALHASGALSDEEFAAAKQRVLQAGS